jgi:thioester reductase-like protein
VPSSNESYSYTKAIAEKALADSGLAARIFRLGILVGDSRHGEIEKIDGPYYLMRFLHKLSLSPGARFLPWLPIPLLQSGTLPLVPVDSAAEIFYRALFLKPVQPGKQEFYGTYHSTSVETEVLCHWMFDHFLPHCQPKITALMPPWLLKVQTHLTQIPKEVFSYSLKPVPLENPRFEEVFGKDAIPHFNNYEEPFLNGFRECLRIF